MSYSKRWRRGTSSSRFGNTWASGESRGDTAGGTLAKPGAGVGRRWGFDGQRDNMSAADNRQAQRSLLFGFDDLAARTACTRGGRLVLLPFDASEFFGIGEYKIHVL